MCVCGRGSTRAAHCRGARWRFDLRTWCQWPARRAWPLLTSTVICAEACIQGGQRVLEAGSMQAPATPATVVMQNVVVGADCAE